MNRTHHLYLLLATAQQDLLHILEKIALTTPLEEAQARLEPHLSDEQRVSIDYPRLCAFLRKDVRGWDLQEQDVSGMPLAGFQLAGANLRGANVHGATLTGAGLQGCDLRGANLGYANLTGADLRNADVTECHMERARLTKACCRRVQAQRIRGDHAILEGSDWRGADLTGARLEAIAANEASFAEAYLDSVDLSAARLQGACLRNAHCFNSSFALADLRNAQLRGANLCGSTFESAQLEGADLEESICSRTHWGHTWQVDAQTRLSPTNHMLIGMALLDQARTVAQQQFALFVQFQTDWCWEGFLTLLLRQSGDLVAWAKEVLLTFESLRSTVEYHEKTLEKALFQRRQSFTISHINPQVHALLLAHIDQQKALDTAALCHSLRGILVMAGGMPEMQLTEEHTRQILAYLDRFAESEQASE